MCSKLFMEQGESATNSPLGSPDTRQVVSATVTGMELKDIKTPVSFTLPNPTVCDTSPGHHPPESLSK